MLLGIMISRGEAVVLCCLFVAALFLAAGCASGRLSEKGELVPVPKTKAFRSPADLSHLLLGAASASPERSKIIYIGVYGGEVSSWDGAGFFNPKDWPYYVPVTQEEDFNVIAYHESLMHVVAVQVARRFSNSITLMIRGDSEVVADVVRYLYSPGDKIYLVGHSQGGAVVGQAVFRLKDRGIPVQMMVQMEGFLSPVVVPGNVAQVLNFYVPSKFALCPGREELRAENPALTRISNVPIPDPKGPFAGPCAEHRNIDSDPRVWKMILQQIVDSAS
jgi:hypothetical protein